MEQRHCQCQQTAMTTYYTSQQCHVADMALHVITVRSILPARSGSHSASGPLLKRNWYLQVRNFQETRMVPSNNLYPGDRNTHSQRAYCVTLGKPVVVHTLLPYTATQLFCQLDWTRSGRARLQIVALTTNVYH